MMLPPSAAGRPRSSIRCSGWSSLPRVFLFICIFSVKQGRMPKRVLLFACILIHFGSNAQTREHDPHARAGHDRNSGDTANTTYLLRPDRVFDGEQMHERWVVVVHGRTIEAAGPAASIQTPAGTTVMEL